MPLPIKDSRGHILLDSKKHRVLDSRPLLYDTPSTVGNANNPAIGGRDIYMPPDVYWIKRNGNG